MNTPSGSFLRRAGCLSRLALACLAAPLAAAGELPTGFKPVSGAITQDLGTPGALNLQQNSERAIVNWDSFSIGQDNAVNISQPGRRSMLLNRVQGGLPSEIAGRLTANGRVFLVNPNGVVFGSGAQVSTGGLVASTLDIADDDFNAGRLKFSRADGNQAAVINRGALQAGPGGTVALLGAVVRNEGTIKADGGTAALVSARQLSLDFEGDGLTTFRIDADKPAGQALVENAAGGVVQADGGRVAILADPASAAQLVVNQQGVLRARSLEQRAGEIVLGVGADDRAEVAGRLDASGGPGLPGGTVAISGGGLYLSERAEVDAGGGAGGGRIEVKASRSAALAAGSRLNADARDNGKGGTLNLQGGDSLRAHGSLQARGAGQGAGGFVETSARALDLSGVQVDTAGAPGQAAGSWLIDPFNITVLPCCDTGESSDPVLDSPFDPVVADSIVFDSAISAALDAGSNVRIHTGPAAAGEIGGDIVIGDGVSILRQEATGGALELRFDANQSISGGFFSIASTAAPLNLVFNANANGFRPEAGFIRLGGNAEVTSSLRTLGGSVRFIGQSDSANGTASNAFGSGILIDGLEIDTRDAILGGSGEVVMRGRAEVSFSSEDAPDAGVKVQNTRIDTAGGQVLIQGSVAGTGSFGLYGVLIGQSEIATGAGTLGLEGTALPGVNGGLQVTGSSLASQSGNIRLAGLGQASDFGLAVFQSTLSTSTGSFELDGTTDAGTVGAVVSASQIGAGSGDTLIRGRTGSGQFGLLLASSDVGADSGDLTLIGLAGQADAAPLARIGLAVAGGSLVAGQGDIDLRGRVAAASETDGSPSAGLLFGFGEIGSGEVRADAGNVSLAGEAAEGSSVAGLRFADSGASVFAGNELLIRAASADPTQPALDVAAASALRGAALVNLRPGGVAADGNPTEHFATPIQIGVDPVEGGLSVSNFLIDQTLIDRLSTTPRLVLGSDGQAGSIVVVGSPSFAESTLGELTLQAEGSGGAIDLRAPLSLPGGGLALLADGPLTQQDGAPLTAARLVASSRSDSVQLAAANGVGALAGRAAGAFRFRNATGDLRLAELAFTAMSGEVGGERSQAGVQAGTTLVLNAEGGNLTQDSPASLAAASLLATGSSGVLLDNPDNETGSLAGTAGQSFGYRDATGIVLGSVDGVSGVRGVQVSLRAGSGDLTQQAGADIVANGLLASSETGSVLLDNPGNDTGLLAGTAGQGFGYRDATGIVLDNIDNVSGVRAAQVSLRAGSGDLSQNAGADIHSDSLRASSETGSVLLVNATNETGSLAGEAGQSFGYRDATGIILGSIDDVSGVRAAQVSLRAENGDLSQNAGADIHSDSLRASSETGSVLLVNATNETGSLAGAAGQGFGYRDATGIVLGSIDDVSGVRGVQVSLRAGDGDLTQQVGADIAAGSLLATSSSGVLLDNPGNETGSLVGLAGQTFSYRDATGIVLGGFDGVSGVRAAQVSLWAGRGDLSQSAGADIHSDSLLASSETGSVLLANAANETGSLAGTAGQGFGYRDATGIVLGSIDDVSGVQAAQVSLRAGSGDLSQNAGADILADGLLASSEAGSVWLVSPGNALHALAGRAAGTFVFTNAGALRIGSVDGLSGIQASQVLLVGNGDLDQEPGADIVADRLLAVGTGSVRLENPGNEMSLLVGLAGPTFSYRDATGVVLGSVDGLLSGIQASQVLLRAGNGDLSQSAGADILADSLLAISETGSVRLENSTNAPYVLAGRAAGAFVFVNADALRIGTVDGVSGVVAGSVLVRNLLGDLTLDAPVTATAGSAVLATGGRLQNPGGQGVTASSFRQIWADTWIGETRGGLAGSGPTPNLYGCVYGGACVSTDALEASAADNHFLYRQQPSARVVFNSYALPLGTLPGPLFEVDGLVLDDAGNGIEVSPQSDGLRGGPPGVHVLNGSLTSAEGYLLTSVPGTLTYYLSPEVVQRPDWVRRRPDTWLYDHNLASASMCPAPGITTPSRVEEGDELSREWSLVKSRPRLGSCVPGDKRNGCADF